MGGQPIKANIQTSKHMGTHMSSEGLSILSSLLLDTSCICFLIFALVPFVFIRLFYVFLLFSPYFLIILACCCFLLIYFLMVPYETSFSCIIYTIRIFPFLFFEVCGIVSY